MHCLPTDTGDSICEGPAGNGDQYNLCDSREDCAEVLECVFIGVDACCLTWCTSDFDCAISELCTELDPPVYIGAQEYGLCWDGDPCVL